MWSAILGIGKKILGSAVGQKIVGHAASALFNSIAQRRANRQNYEAQKEFAQMGLQWRAEDARQAGLHPMAALGAAGASFSPSFGAFDSPGAGLARAAIDAGLSEMGQNTTRAQRAAQDDHARQVNALTIRRMELENAALEGQISQMWAGLMQPSNPPYPGPRAAVAGRLDGQVADGRAPAGVVEVVPSESKSARPGDRGTEAGSSPVFKPVDISNSRQWRLIAPDHGETFEAYGELAKPFLAAAAHFAAAADDPSTMAGRARARARRIMDSIRKRRGRLPPNPGVFNIGR